MMKLTARTFHSPRHVTHYLESGPVDGPLMIFLHGWPEIGLMWRAQIKVFASEGWRCIAPDMRGYGGSSAPAAFEAYALNEIVDDMVELHDHLGARPAIWVGHDWGSPVAGAISGVEGPNPRKRTVRNMNTDDFPGILEQNHQVRSGIAMNWPFMASNHRVQYDGQPRDVFETPHCTPQEGGLTCRRT
jgi:hypothetical protein